VERTKRKQLDKAFVLARRRRRAKTAVVAGSFQKYDLQLAWTATRSGGTRYDMYKLVHICKAPVGDISRRKR
jgi:hypothetical protein